MACALTPMPIREFHTKTALPDGLLALAHWEKLRFEWDLFSWHQGHSVDPTQTGFV